MIETQPIIDIARESADIVHRIGTISHPDDKETVVPVVLETSTDGDGAPTSSVKLAGEILAELDKRLPGPRRRTGIVRLTEVASFIDYVNRYADDKTVVYADTKALGFTAVLDEHPAGPAATKATAAWRDHRATYACPRSPEWIAWTAKDGQGMRQEEFADFLEARLEDLVTADGFPKPVDVLGIARQLHIKTKGEFKREVNPTNGDNILICKTETDQGSTQIPRAFMIAVPVFEGGDRYQVEARIRFALREGVPMFSYSLHRRPEVERDAFTGVREQIAASTGRLLLAGTP